MSAVCPGCKQKIVVKAPKPGRFKIKCAKCGHGFVLVVADDLTMRAANAKASPEGAPAGTAPAGPAPHKPTVTMASDVPQERATPRRPDTSGKTVVAGADAAALDDADFDMTAVPHVEAAAREPAAESETTAFHEDEPAQAQKRPAPSGDDADRTAALEEPASAGAAEADGDATAAHEAPAHDRPLQRKRRVATDATAAVEVETPAGTRARMVKLEEAEAEAKVTAARASDEEATDDMPAVLGNYDIIKRLGRGGMGAVYLARQRSLDRAVAVKVINRQWADNPRFLVRFTREAYAAAQLVHHNVVQVYDIGQDAGVNWFSMEFVDGTTLGGLLARKGRLDPKMAAGYILQAARGLAFAHERGMVHRDIKPDNLMLNKQGVVKVADLGLVRTPGAADETSTPDAEAPAKKPAKVPVAGTLSSLAGVTLVNQTMGTPAYMAPEQARDATHVDARADIYSLGCTLYVLITGRPVFRGKTGVEVMKRHQSEPITPPDVHVKGIPKTLSEIILKMLKKDPAERYQTTGALIAALEEYLGIGVGTATPFTDEHVQILEAGVKAFNDAPMARRRALILGASMGLCGLLMLVSLVGGAWFAAAAFLGMAVLTPLAAFVVNGIYSGTFAFKKAREYVLGNRWYDWAKLTFVALMLLLSLYFTGLLFAWLAVCALAVGIAFGLHFLIDRTIARQRQGTLDEVEKMLKSLRVRGVSEMAVQEYVCRFAGNHWEAAFEALFGYEAKLTARAWWGPGPKGPRPKYAAWRDRLVQWIEDRQRSRQEARERKHLQAIEQKNLEADGMKPAEARRQAAAVAVAMVEMAAEMKHEADEQAPAKAPPKVEPRIFAKVPAAPAGDTTIAEEKPRPARVDLRQICDVTNTDRDVVAPRKSKVLANNFGIFVGGVFRLLIGAMLFCIGLWWLNHAKVTEGFTAGALVDVNAWKMAWTKAGTTPLEVSGLPFSLDPTLCLALGVAGFLLLMTTFQNIRWLALLHYVCVAVIIGGPRFGVPELGPLTPGLASIAIGSCGSLLLIVFAWMRPRAH